MRYYCLLTTSCIQKQDWTLDQKKKEMYLQEVLEYKYLFYLLYHQQTFELLF